LRRARIRDPEFEKGAHLISIIGNSNIVAVTPSVDSCRNVYLWDHLRGSAVATIVCVNTVKGIRLRPDILIIATVGYVSVRSFRRFTEIAGYAAGDNGIFDVRTALSSSLVAFQAPDTGVVSIANYLDPAVALLDLQAFQSPVSFVRFSA